MKRLVIVAAALTCVAGLAFGQAADKYPSKPVKIIVPYGPGGATDIVARILADQIGQEPRPVVLCREQAGRVRHRRARRLARSPADGYTLMIGNVSTNAITPIIYAAKLKIDYPKTSCRSPTPSISRRFWWRRPRISTSRRVPELIAYAKKNPGQVRYGTVGPGSYPHYDMAYFAKRAGDLDMIAIPNKAGASGVINDMLAGSTQVAFLNVASTAPQVKAGNFRALAVVNHARLPDYPDLPTMQELGFAGVGTIAWQGLFAPAGTPKDVLQAVFDATVAAMKTPEVERGVQEADLQHRSQRLARRRQSWLGARDGYLAQDHQRSEDRDGVIFVIAGLDPAIHAAMQHVFS